MFVHHQTMSYDLVLNALLGSFGFKYPHLNIFLRVVLFVVFVRTGKRQVRKS